jgi:hypothetical protein
MKKIPIYIVTTPEGNNLVRTTNRATGPWLEAHPGSGYKVTTGWVYPKAARDRRQGGGSQRRQGRRR